MNPKATVLVIASRTAGSPELIAALRERQDRVPTRFTLLVPAVPHGLSWAADMKAGWQEAMARAEAASARMRMAGIELESAIVGDPDPFAAAGDVLHVRAFDGVLISVLPRHVSRWLRLSLPDRIARTFGLPVERVIASTGPLYDTREPEHLAA